MDGSAWSQAGAQAPPTRLLTGTSPATGVATAKLAQRVAASRVPTELRKTLRACWSPSLPSPSPWASSCTRIPARVFSSPLRATAGGVRARLGTSVPGRRLDEPGRCEVRTERGDLVHV